MVSERAGTAYRTAHRASRFQANRFGRSLL